MNTHTATHRLAATLAAALAVSLSACVSTDDSSGNDDGAASRTNNPASGTSGPSNLSGLDLTAHVDPENASVSLPSDRLLVSADEEEFISTAYRAAQTLCARAQGVPWERSWRLPDDPILNAWNQYGPWTAEVAQRFAFVEPQTETSLIRNRIIFPETPQPEPTLVMDMFTEDQLAIGHECHNDPQVKEFDTSELHQPGPWYDAVFDAYDQAEKDPRGLQLFEELSACYADNGMEMDPEQPGFIVGAQQYAVTREVELTENCRTDGPAGGDDTCGIYHEPTGESAINEEQIALALTTVQCKDSINFTQRMADLIAEKQAPGIEKYADEIIALRTNADELLAKAKEYNAAHPEAFEDAE